MALDTDCMYTMVEPGSRTHEDENRQCKSCAKNFYIHSSYGNVYLKRRRKRRTLSCLGFNSLLLPYVIFVIFSSLRMCIIDAASVICSTNHSLSSGCAATDDSYSNVACLSADLHSWPETVPCSLRILLLRGNQIQSLDSPSSLWPSSVISNITTLTLEKNNIAFIDGATFHGFTALEKLCLSQNKISTTNWISSLYNSPNLQQLDLSDNLLDDEMSEDWLPVRMDRLKRL